MLNRRRVWLVQAICALVFVFVFIQLQKARKTVDTGRSPTFSSRVQPAQDKHSHAATNLTRRYESVDWASLDERAEGNPWAAKVRYGTSVLCMLEKSKEDTAKDQKAYMSYEEMKDTFGWEVSNFVDRNPDPPNKSPAGIGLDVAFEKLGIDADASKWYRLEQIHQDAKKKQENGVEEVVWEATHATYENSYSAANKMIIAEMNFGPVWCNEFYELNLAKEKIWTCEKKKLDFRIEHVIQHNVIDDDVFNVLRTVIQSDKLGRDKGWPGYEFDTTSSDTANQAKAVLSVANSKGVWWMLASHKAKFGLMKIDHIKIFECSKKSTPANAETWCIYYHYVDV